MNEGRKLENFWWIIASLVGCFLVFAAIAVSNFGEQFSWGERREFPFPAILPLTFDGTMVVFAILVTVASLDGRLAIFARLGVLLATCGSGMLSASSAYDRTMHPATDGYIVTEKVPYWDAVIFAGLLPFIALAIFEAIMFEIRRMVQKLRGRPSPKPVPVPRALAWFLAPWSTPRRFREIALMQVGAELDEVEQHTRAATARAAITVERVESPAPVPAPVRAAIAPVPHSRSGMSQEDKIEAARAIVAQLGGQVGVTKFREAARAAGITGGNGDMATLLRLATEGVEHG